MFLLGVLVGIGLASAFIWLCLAYGAGSRLGRLEMLDLRGQLSGIERRTIQQMLAEEMATRASGESETVEGTASEIVRRPS
jgi:hypothetical protein